MTIIDTTLYANGALRLSRHGAGRGGNVLTHVPSGEQVSIPDASLHSVIELCSETSEKNAMNLVADLHEQYNRY